MFQILEELQKLQSLIQAQGILKKDVLTFDEACSYTGISKSHMYKLTSGSRISFYKPGGKMVFFKREELNDWLLKNRNTTESELDQMAQAWSLKNGRAKK
ncbi:excisionase family DNA-binding protein [Roseivirga echinicomitans]